MFRDCVLVKKGTTVKDCARNVMGDAPLAYVEGAGGVRVAEDEVITVGKNDVSVYIQTSIFLLTRYDIDTLI